MPLAGAHLPTQLGEDDELEGRADRERLIGLVAGNQARRPVAEPGDRETGLARQGAELGEHRGHRIAAHLDIGDEQAVDQMRRHRRELDVDRDDGALVIDPHRSGSRRPRRQSGDIARQAILRGQLAGDRPHLRRRHLGEESGREERRRLALAAQQSDDPISLRAQDSVHRLGARRNREREQREQEA